MRILWLALFGVALALASADPAAAADKTKGALVSPPLSINPNDGQPLCLAANVSATETVAVTLEIIDASGAVAVTTSYVLGPGASDAATDRIAYFYSYCRITPANPAQLSLLRGTHCIASANTSRTCLEAR